MNTNLLVFAAVAALSTGCAVRVHRPGPPPEPRQQPPPVVVVHQPPPPPQARQPMTYDEAVRAGMSYAHSRGYQARLKEAHQTGNDKWKVKLEVEQGSARGKLHLEYDAWSRALIGVDENVKEKKHAKRGHGNGHEHDDTCDHDDDDDHKGREHKASAVAGGKGH